MFASSAWRQEAPCCGRQAGWGLGTCADGDNHSVKGIHAPLTCYCELPAALADNCHLSLGKHSQTQAEGQPFCFCRCSLPHIAEVRVLLLTLTANVFSI